MASDTYIIDKFIKRCSFNGLISLYVCYLSNKTGKGFIIDDIEKKIDRVESSYFLGYIVACRAFGLIDYRVNNNGMIFTIPEYDEYLGSKIENSVLERAKKNDSEKPPNKITWLQKTEQVKAYFGI